MTAGATRAWRSGPAAAVLVAMVLLAGCATRVPLAVAPPGSDAAPQPAAALQAWGRVLQRFVDAQGRVDFHALAGDRADLDRYLHHVAALPLDAPMSDDERMAHLINAYNALSMANVIDSGFPASHAGLAKLRFFALRQFPVGGRWLSLYRLENDVIRPLGRSRGDPRLHFALNCSALSCPVLPRRPFSAATLDAELDAEARAFFARPQNFRVDDAGRTFWLSAILDFYSDDFAPAPAPSLAAYANRYAARPAPVDYAVRFTPYDWTVAYPARAPSATPPAP